MMTCPDCGVHFEKQHPIVFPSCRFAGSIFQAAYTCWRCSCHPCVCRLSDGGHLGRLERRIEKLEAALSKPTVCIAGTTPAELDCRAEMRWGCCVYPGSTHNAPCHCGVNCVPAIETYECQFCKGVFGKHAYRAHLQDHIEEFKGKKVANEAKIRVCERKLKELKK